MLLHFLMVFLLTVGIKPPDFLIEGQVKGVQVTAPEPPGSLLITPVTSGTDRHKITPILTPKFNSDHQENLRTTTESGRTNTKIASYSAEELVRLKKAETERKEKFLTELKTIQQKTTAEYKTKRTQFFAKLATLTSAAKKKTLTDLDVKLSQMNTNRVNALSDQLTKIEALLTKIIDNKSVSLNPPTNLATLISSAQGAIVAAKTVITTQAGKQYIIPIDSEANLKINADATISSVSADLKNVQDAVLSARLAVLEVIKSVYLKTSPHPTGATSSAIP
jgi:hypothetical protein